MMKRFLITTADERTWKTDVPVLFLGAWCTIYSRKHIWSKFDAEMVPYHWDDRTKLDQDYQHLRNRYEKILFELAAKLNEIHHVDHSLRYWRILIGPWLFYFVQILFDRWEMVRLAIDHFEISGTSLVKDGVFKLVPNDMDDFMELFVSDAWNGAIYSHIIESLVSDQYQWKIYSVDAVRSHPDLRDRGRFFQHFIQSLKLPFSRIGSIKVRDDEVFLFKPFFPMWMSFLLQRRLGQMPHWWQRDIPKRVEVKHGARQWEIRNVNGDLFGEALCKLIPYQIPVQYLEGYPTLVSQAFEQPWPKHPRAMMTSISHIHDDIFKVWAATQAEKRIPLIIYQHGGGYGISKFFTNEDHEMSIADCWLSWGWESSLSKIRKAFYPGLMLKKKRRGKSWNARGYALLVTNTYPRYSYKLTAEVIAGQWLEYFELQCNFIDHLKDHIRSNLLVRLRGRDFDWGQRQRWLERFPNIHYAQEVHVPMASLIKNTRLYISTYNATTYLESLAGNIPTIMFWKPSHGEIRESAVPYFQVLKEAGIYHDTPESAAATVSEIWEDVAAWWYQPAIQAARAYFCDHFARVVDNPVRFLKETVQEVLSDPIQMGSPEVSAMVEQGGPR